MQQYETVVVLAPLLSEEAVKEAMDKFTQFLISHGAEIIQKENWGLKQLAYPIQKKTKGYYCLIEFRALGALIHKLETEYRRDERIMRFLTVTLDRHAVAYNDKRRKGAFSKSKIAKPEEVVQ